MHMSIKLQFILQNIKIHLVVNIFVFESIKFLHTYRNATVGGLESSYSFVHSEDTIQIS